MAWPMAHTMTGMQGVATLRKPSHHMGLKWITAWWFQRNIKKYDFVNGKDDIPYMKWKIKNVPNHQPDYIIKIN